MHAGDVGLSRDEIPLFDPVHFGTDLDHGAGELMAHDLRDAGTDPLLGPLVPLVDVHVRAADGGRVYLHQGLVRADLRDRHLLQLRPGRPLGLDHRAHCLRHDPVLPTSLRVVFPRRNLRPEASPRTA